MKSLKTPQPNPAHIFRAVLRVIAEPPEIQTRHFLYAVTLISDIIFYISYF